MIIDCFTFNSEFDMLEYRLHTLYDTVDYFILVEATNTHPGKPKELFFNLNKSRYEQYLDKIIHVIVTDMPNTSNAWDNENHQRRCIKRGLEKLILKDNDLIVISDLDEIPNKNKLKEIDQGSTLFGSLIMDLYYYSLNCKIGDWSYARVMSYSILRDTFNLNTHDARMLPSNYVVPNQDIENGGWHLSYFGNSEFIKNKLENTAHQEFNTEQLRDTNLLNVFINNNYNFVTNKHYKLLLIDENTFPPTDLPFLMKYFPCK
jgi:beta-1,4-mannosyl-glycoprotein beta-1,4-N-acetylglucosaminyltransferase